MMRIGIFGGTFDPVHTGHLFIAKKAQEQLKIDKIIFIPAYIPPHKNHKNPRDAVHRVNMLRLALKGERRFSLSLVEIKRKGRSYSIDTVKYFRRKYGPKTSLFFLIGADSATELDAWKDIDRLMDMTQFVVAPRPGQRVRDGFKGLIKLKMKPKNISSSEIRERLRRKQPITGLVPEAVRGYIYKNRLYT